MKQFQKIGVAAAVASVAAGAVAQQVSRSETGDLAIIPYYTVKDGINTGMHIINTTDSTQVIKVRLRRGTDSKDALDFNLVMSPRDEWTANIGAGGANGVVVTTNDNTCTVPEFPEGGAEMPSTFSEGATEGYVEVIAMAETVDEKSHMAIAAKHQEATGAPLSCAIVRQNFYRVMDADAGDGDVRGTHTSELASSGVCTGVNTSELLGNDVASALGVCAFGTAQNISAMQDSDDNALKVSFMLTDPNGGLEAGDNAVMVEGFSADAMMTNQQPLSFGTDGLLNYDALNFELPNLAYGAYPSASGRTGTNATDGSKWDGVADALDADSIMNDWAGFATEDGTVDADWVVTLPGQYVMVDPICDIYTTYSEANATAAAACATTAAAAYLAAGADQNQLPLLVASNVDGGALIQGSNMNLWDREEMPLAGEETPPTPEDPDLGFSPGGSSGDPADPDINVVLPYEVNVIAFGEDGADSAVMSDLKLTVTPPATYDRGWARLDIESTNAAPAVWNIGAVADGADVLTVNGANGGFTPVADATDTAVVGFAVWQRSFADQAGNYGRMIEHSTITSGSTTR